MGKEKDKEKKLNIYQRINAVCKEVEYIQKKDKAPKGLPYKYVSHDQVMGALHKPMAEHGIVLVSTMDDFKQDGNRTTVAMTVSFVNIDDPKDRIDVKYSTSAIDPSDKGAGKCVSYIIKYVLLKTFCLETGEDADKDQYEYKPETVSEEQLMTLELKINGYDDLRGLILKRFNGNLKKMTVEQYNLAIKWLQKEIEKKDADYE